MSRPPRRAAGPVRVGVAGWSLPRGELERFPPEGSHLERYAARFPAVEINSSFYRPHRPATYERWAASVPPGFRFSVKLPKLITHTLRLRDAEAQLDAFLAEAGSLGAKLGCLLVQLPPKLEYDPDAGDSFFRALRERTPVPVACEPRHPSWFGAVPDRALAGLGVARVLADPLIVPEGAEPGGSTALVYYRLHGSPRIYWSAYPEAYLSALADAIAEHRAAGREVWCIFDNTTAGAATRNGIDLLEMLG